jgi:protein-S-isoprenylcysteine O-methyltransferase Ste14
MSLDFVERLVWWLGAASALAMTLVVLRSTLRAGSKRMGRVAGRRITLLHSPWFMVIGTIGGVALCWLLWEPIAPELPDGVRITLLILGGVLYFGGLGLAFWGRIALGEMHNVSSSFGAELFEGHRLITSGPFAYVRNPMYIGAFGWGIGGLLMYRTWTLALLAICLLVFFRRARREEEALAAEFGAEWADYARRVPAWMPRPGRVDTEPADGSSTMTR